MEWLFIGNNTIVPMEYTNMSWNNEIFGCRQMPNVEHSQPELMILTVKGKRSRHHCLWNIYETSIKSNYNPRTVNFLRMEQ